MSIRCYYPTDLFHLLFPSSSVGGASICRWSWRTPSILHQLFFVKDIHRPSSRVRWELYWQCGWHSAVSAESTPQPPHTSARCLEWTENLYPSYSASRYYCLDSYFFWSHINAKKNQLLLYFCINLWQLIKSQQIIYLCFEDFCNLHHRFKVWLGGIGDLFWYCRLVFAQFISQPFIVQIAFCKNDSNPIKFRHLKLLSNNRWMSYFHFRYQALRAINSIWLLWARSLWLQSYQN